ncbi:hypothetical protein HY948_04000 [Candidatus Gottesmanbacteria bacterium]|nr:hypothetical protein [Candidatus Gottesmanbacteria bacterium]
MNKKLVGIGLAIVLVLTIGLVAYTFIPPKKSAKPTVTEETVPQDIETLSPSVQVTVSKSKVKDNTVVLSVLGLASKYTSVAYELSYETQGIIQGATSKPLDIGGKDSFVRDDIYLGTCSRNVCRPHSGVKSVSLVLEFISLSGKKSQFSKDFDL